MTEFNQLEPAVVLGVVAHPDDLEVTVAGSMAKYIQQGAKAYYYILTNGDKGSDDRSADPDQLREIRRDEQRAAAKILGVTDVFFADYPDGGLEVSQAVKRDAARIIRKVKPDTVVTFDPTHVYSLKGSGINHTDHRAAGQATIDAVYPLARDHLSFPELLAEGLEPHKVKTLLMINFDSSNYLEDITATFDQKAAALQAHTSQFTDLTAVTEWLRSTAGQLGQKLGPDRLAEGFVRIDIK